MNRFLVKARRQRSGISEAEYPQVSGREALRRA
jgi:hypothetical protein